MVSDRKHAGKLIAGGEGPNPMPFAPVEPFEWKGLRYGTLQSKIYVNPE